MTLYYLNPNDEPRECPGCYDCVPRQHQDVTFNGRDLCGGTGQLGNSEAPRFETRHVPTTENTFNGQPSWAWRSLPDGFWYAGGATEPLAVAAARAALKGGN